MGVYHGILLLCVGATAALSEEHDRWDGGFFLSGIQGEIRAIGTNGNTLYVGGLFTSADNVPVTNLARWTGTNWSAVGGGANGEVNAIAIHGNDIFIAGTFSQAGSVPASRIARWNSAGAGEWTALGPGIAGTRVTALALDVNGVLYAGGEFTNAGGVAVANVAKWNGTTWSALGSGLRNDPYAAWVLALATRGTELFAGGFFTDAGGVTVSCIAKWNGAGWTSLGSGVDDLDYLPQVTALAVSGNDLYVGGAFAKAGNVAAANVARWDGAAWSALGSGMGRYFGEIPVTALAVRGSRLLAGGRFISAGGTAANNLAVWDGANWSELGGGATGKIRALSAAGSNVFVGGSFTTTNHPANRAVAKWNDTSGWQHVSSAEGLGISGEEVTAMTRFESNTYVAGTFDACGSVIASNIAAWNGVSWSALGSGVNGSVLALCTGADRVFVGGRFSTAGGVNTSNVASWDGTRWRPLGTGVSGAVEALAWTGSDLIVGGSFSLAGGINASNVARWDGSQWASLGNGVNGAVYALAIQGSNVFVGGRFTSAGGIAASNIARWNGGQWFPVGGGVGGVVNPFVRIRPPPVSALTVRANELFVGGDFAWAGGVAATNIAKWDASAWHAFGSGVTGASAFAPPPTTSTIAINAAGVLYVGGSFISSGNRPIPSIAAWTGSAWEPLGGGITHRGGSIVSVNAAQVSGDGELLVGGRFGFAGEKPSANFAIWDSRVLLSISRALNGVEISWNAAASNFVLEATSSLDRDSWNTVAGNPVLRGTKLVLGENGDGPQKFYRLRRE